MEGRKGRVFLCISGIFSSGLVVVQRSFKVVVYMDLAWLRFWLGFNRSETKVSSFLLYLWFFFRDVLSR
jgi:hypothetical protein